MKMPNGYGGIVKLSDDRRKPWAVRVSQIIELPDGTIKRQRKYLAYFEKQKSALKYLAEYNSGLVIPEHAKLSDAPTFGEMYVKWKKYKNSLKGKLTDGTWRSYEVAYSHLTDLHPVKIINVKVDDVQQVLNSYNHKGKTTISHMRVLLKGVFSYALMNKYIETDITQFLEFEYTNPSTQSHSRFSDAEIKLLWDNLYVVNNVDIILIYIYTGMRPTELLEILIENVHLEEKYMIGGMKTENGRDRTIPIHDKILPLIRKRCDKNKRYLINNRNGNHYTYGSYKNGNWKTVVEKLGINHNPHDCRYTFASLADNAAMNDVCLKLIIGHSIQDITKGVYTQKTLGELLVEINKI